MLRLDGDVAVRPTLHRNRYERIGSCPRLPSEKLKLFDFLAPSTAITLDVEVYRLGHKFFRPGDGSSRTLLGLTRWIKTEMAYALDSTRIGTRVATFLRQRTRVCQDFAQIMIAIIRLAEIPRPLRHRRHHDRNLAPDHPRAARAALG